MMALAMDTPRGEAKGNPDLDRATLERCTKGDPLAFRAFVVRHERAVFALLSRMMGRGAPVEDLAQETFLRAYRALPTFDLDGPARVSTWLLTIATRLALDARKRKQPEVGDPKETELAPDPRTPETERARRELGRAIARAAEALPDDQRAAFVLAEFHGMSIADIAGALDVPENTAKTRLFRAREKMRAALESWRSQ
jgi:RNA polymerase sigma-70 factor (ECF subfamily)